MSAERKARAGSERAVRAAEEAAGTADEDESTPQERGAEEVKGDALKAAREKGEGTVHP
ncbi:CsbD family protein [Streptomyces sp. PTM05]|uniref:CsbD family protein n=1 Tax=Streptantibioticus parmotrematis TaxID=2873249 RepID=A0ABS7QQ74_9ACTN|nr:CsbD family protein [Streptantibioticus parmotrematis]MBY8885338.1 CsbD family protein [Streptantibioticus parmotrematis]